MRPLVVLHSRLRARHGSRLFLAAFFLLPKIGIAFKNTSARPASEALRKSARNNDFGLACKGTRGKIKAAAVKEIKSAAALEVFHSVLLACNCNISKQSGKWLHKIRKKVALAAKKNAKKLFLLRCCYCGAKILFVPQKERVKALIASARKSAVE